MCLNGHLTTSQHNRYSNLKSQHGIHFFAFIYNIQLCAELNFTDSGIQNQSSVFI